MTNYVPKGTKGTPLTKLLRQLRIPYDALDLSPQNCSKFTSPTANSASTTISFFRAKSPRLPRQIDGFLALAEEVRASTPLISALYPPPPAQPNAASHLRFTVGGHDFLPVMYYGSAQEHDMDYGQFAIMFRSLFFEGFARPLGRARDCETPSR